MIHKLVNCVWNKEELAEQWKESIIVPVYKKGYKTECYNYRRIPLLSTTYKHYSVKVNATHRRDFYYWVNFDIIDQLLIRYSAFVRYWGRG
jgi:hypothetical protein